VQEALRRYLDLGKLSVVKAGDFPAVTGAADAAPAN